MEICAYKTHSGLLPSVTFVEMKSNWKRHGSSRIWSHYSRHFPLYNNTQVPLCWLKLQEVVGMLIWIEVMFSNRLMSVNLYQVYPFFHSLFFVIFSRHEQKKVFICLLVLSHASLESRTSEAPLRSVSYICVVWLCDSLSMFKSVGWNIDLAWAWTLTVLQEPWLVLDYTLCNDHMDYHLFPLHCLQCDFFLIMTVIFLYSNLSWTLTAWMIHS